MLELRREPVNTVKNLKGHVCSLKFTGLKGFFERRYEKKGPKTVR